MEGRPTRAPRASQAVETERGSSVSGPVPGLRGRHTHASETQLLPTVAATRGQARQTRKALAPWFPGKWPKAPWLFLCSGALRTPAAQKPLLAVSEAALSSSPASPNLMSHTPSGCRHARRLHPPQGRHPSPEVTCDDKFLELTLVAAGGS